MIKSIHISAPTNVVRTNDDYAAAMTAQREFMRHVNIHKLARMLTREGAECLVSDAGLIASLLRDRGFKVVISDEKVKL